MNIYMGAAEQIPAACGRLESNCIVRVAPPVQTQRQNQRCTDVDRLPCPLCITCAPSCVHNQNNADQATVGCPALGALVVRAGVGGLMVLVVVLLFVVDSPVPVTAFEHSTCCSCQQFMSTTSFCSKCCDEPQTPAAPHPPSISTQVT